MSIVDSVQPDKVDTELPNPGMSQLTALSKTEAEISLDFVGRPGKTPTPAFAVVNLTTGCIVATRTREQDAIRDAGDDAAQITYLESASYRDADAQHLAAVARFDHHTIAAVVARVRSDGVRTVSADHQKIAVRVGDRVFYSSTGGRAFERVAGDLASGSVWNIYFGLDDRLLYIELGGGGRRETAIVNVAGEALEVLGTVPTMDFTPLRVFSKNGKPLLAHQSNRCIHELDERTRTLPKLMCLQGPSLPNDRFFAPDLSPAGTFGVYVDPWAQGKGVLFDVSQGATVHKMPSTFNTQVYQSDLQNFHFGPDDGGRFGWDSHRGLRVATPAGVFDNPWPKPVEEHSPLGFDLEGNVLWFNRPPLVGPHRPMTLMPPTKGKLGDSLCSLVSRSDPTLGKKVLPAL